MDIIQRSTRKFKSSQAKNPLPFCYTNHNNPSPIDRFLHGVRRESTRKIGLALFSMLSSGPRVVNYSQLARLTGYSQTTVTRAIKFFSRFGKVSRINERHTGSRRPCMHKLHPSFTETQEAAKLQEKARCEVSHPYTR